MNFLFLVLDLKFKNYSGWQESHSNCDVKMVGVYCNDPRLYGEQKKVIQ